MTSIAATSLSLPNRDLVRQLARFGAIGTVSTIAYVALYSLLREVAPAAVANAAALLTTAFGNTAANRRLTFAVRGSGGLIRDHAAGLIAVAVALAITSVSLAALPVADPHHGRLAEIAILVGANAVATLVRFLILRQAMDSDPADRNLQTSAARAFATLSQSKRTRG
jgi:putative flippase GtrA